MALQLYNDSLKCAKSNSMLVNIASCSVLLQLFKLVELSTGLSFKNQKRDVCGTWGDSCVCACV